MSRLLVVDFDFFFPNPLEAGNLEDPHWQLFDWSHGETPLLIDGGIVWPDRAYGFRRNNLPLPDVTIPDGFWDRFTFADTAALYYADSNTYAGVLRDTWGEPFDEVVLFDAHHDLYNIRTRSQMHALLDVGTISCENWMFVHLDHGAALKWRYPHWLTNGADLASRVPKWVGLNAAEDDDQTDPAEYDTVFVCRSGAWVPPWCDDRFVEFVNAAPVDSHEKLDDLPMVREWERAAEQAAAMFDEALRRASLA